MAANAISSSPGAAAVEADGPSRADAFGSALHAFFQPTVDVAQTIRTVVAHQQALNHEIETLNHKMGVAAGLATPQQQRQLEGYVQKLRVSKQRVEALGKLLIAVKGRLWKVHSALQNKTRVLETENAALTTASKAPAAETRELNGQPPHPPSSHKDPNEATTPLEAPVEEVVPAEIAAPAVEPVPEPCAAEALPTGAADGAAGNEGDAAQKGALTSDEASGDVVTAAEAVAPEEAAATEEPQPEESNEAEESNEVIAQHDSVSEEAPTQITESRTEAAPSTPKELEEEHEDHQEEVEPLAPAPEASAEGETTSSAQKSPAKATPPKGASNKGPKGGRGKKR